MRAPHRAEVTVPSFPDAARGWIEEVSVDPTGLRLVVRYPAGEAPVLAVGRSGELRVRHEASGQDVVVMGKVTVRHECERGRLYHFVLGERSRQKLAPILEPRRADRVVVDDDLRARIAFGGGAPGVVEGGVVEGGALEGRVLDLSRAGACVELPWEGEALLAEHVRAGLTLELEGGPVVLEASIQSRRLVPGAIQLGLALRAPSAEDPAGAMARLLDEVERRARRRRDAGARSRRSA